MQLTNSQNLPAPIVNAIESQRKRYQRGSSQITVTELISPPRLVALKWKHQDEIVEDVADLIWSAIGSAVHHLLEMGADDGLAEERFYADVRGWRVGGQFDWLKAGHLVDWKMMSVWEAINGLKAEKEQQLNILAHLARQNGHQIDKLWVGSIYRDWSKRKARTEDGYPKKQVEMHRVTLWEPDRAQAFIEERVALHQAAQKELPKCSADERWGRPNKYAVMREGRAKAMRLLNTQDEAEQWIEQQSKPKGLTIEFRPGESTRCRDYCPASEFCTQFQEGMKNGNGTVHHAH